MMMEIPSRSEDKMVEAEADVEREYHGWGIKEDWNIVQNNRKRSKVAYSDENFPSYPVEVCFVNEEHLIGLSILKNPFDPSQLVERGLGKVKAVRITRGRVVSIVVEDQITYWSHTHI